MRSAGRSSTVDGRDFSARRAYLGQRAWPTDLELRITASTYGEAPRWRFGRGEARVTRTASAATGVAAVVPSGNRGCSRQCCTPKPTKRASNGNVGLNERPARVVARTLRALRARSSNPKTVAVRVFDIALTAGEPVLVNRDPKYGGD
jgi:hypothetical protein